MPTTAKNRGPSRRQLFAGLKPAPLPVAPGPMLATLVDGPFDDDRWIFETKYDGLRILARFDGKRLTMLSRNQQPQNVQFPEVVEALTKSLAVPCIIDGEIVSFDEAGRTSFRQLQQRFHVQNPLQITLRQRQYPALIFLFDVLYADRYDVRGLPLEKRKEILRKIVRWSSHVRWTAPHSGKKGTKLFSQICQEGGEGVIGKRRDSTYVGRRDSRWVKIKCTGRQEFVIGGFTNPEGARQGLGAILVGYYEGDKLRFAGKVGTGYSDAMLRELRQTLGQLEQDRSPFVDAEVRRASGVHWVNPRLVAQIAFGEWTHNGRLRHPRYEGLRPDKSARECRRETPAPH